MSVCYAAVTGIKSGGSNEAGYNSVKVTSVSAKALSFYVSLEETASFFVIVFGKQLQWGDVPTRTLIVSFPISFSSAAYFCTGVEYGSGGIANNSFAPKTVSKTQVEFSNSGRAKKYIVVGK